VSHLLDTQKQATATYSPFTYLFSETITMRNYCFPTQHARSLIFLLVAMASILISGRDVAFGVELVARYNPDSGNMRMVAVDSNGDPTTIAVQSFWFLTNPPRLSTSVSATLPPGVNLALSTVNTDNGVYGQGSEINAVNFNAVSLFNDEWDLGFIVNNGLSQSDVASSFTTDASFTPGGSSVPGGFLYLVVGDGAYTVGSVQVVPEPTGGLLGIVGTACLLAARVKRRRRSGNAFKH
jgi:hypothetical protein